MSYRGAMPSGPVYDGQGQQLPQHHHAQGQLPQHHVQGQYPQQQNHQQHRPQPTHPSLAPNLYPNGNPQYHQVQYSQTGYPQQQPQQQQQQQQQPFYPSSAPQFNNCDGAYQRQPPVPQVAPVQFVDPSFLQRSAPLPQPSYVAPAPPPASQPPPQPARAMIPQQSQPPRQTFQTTSTKNSPALSERQLGPPTALSRPTSKDARRVSSAGSVSKSPTMAHASTHAEKLPLLLSVAEDCLAHASAGAHRIARTMTEEEVAEHHKLVATGLGCLEVAMKSNKLWPRLEARLCLRYASVLIEETTNLMEAETALTRGISVCEKHRFTDLKYSSQFLLMKTLFQRNQKAAFKSIDTHIADCTTYKHIHWIYAFRFLKASFYLKCGTPSDHHALENLRKIAGIAQQRNDNAIFVMAMLLEGLAHLSSMRDDWVTRVQTCIAQASKLQFDDAVHLPQMDVLLLLLDLACSLHQQSHHMSSEKLNMLTTKLDNLRYSPEWGTKSNEILLPINRMPNAQPTISNDTRAVLRPGPDNGTLDYLVLTTLQKQEAYSLAYVFHGIVVLHKASTPGRSSDIWSEAVRLLDDSRSIQLFQSLPEAVEQDDWVKELICYSHVLIGLQAATLSDWTRVKKCVHMIREINPPPGFLDIMVSYLTGVLKQGTGNRVDALEIWKSPMFALDWSREHRPSTTHIERELSILAALNRLWIINDAASRDEAEMSEILEQLQPLCEDNPNMEIKTAYNVVQATISFGPLSMQNVKRHISHALNGSKVTNNTQSLSMALNIMRCRLFDNVVGDQAVKSARAGVAQAKKSGSLIWMSVADGMLASSLQMCGQVQEARQAYELGTQLANEAFKRTQI